jgi:hypothetical protein
MLQEMPLPNGPLAGALSPSSSVLFVRGKTAGKNGVRVELRGRSWLSPLSGRVSMRRCNLNERAFCRKPIAARHRASRRTSWRSSPPRSRCWNRRHRRRAASSPSASVPCSPPRSPGRAGRRSTSSRWRRVRSSPPAGPRWCSRWRSAWSRPSLCATAST